MVKIKKWTKDNSKTFLYERCGFEIDYSFLNVNNMIS